MQKANVRLGDRLFVIDAMSKKSTLKDVARYAGVSYQTVSKVIRSEIQVSPEVRARIHTAVEALDYSPNVAAQNLRTQSSRLIGYSWQPDRQNSLGYALQQFQHSIVEAAEDLGYHVLLFPQRHNRDLYETYAELVQTGRVDGFVLTSVEYEDPRIGIISQLGVPAVCFGRAGDAMPAPYVDVDGHRGIGLAVEHLIGLGHQRIAMLGWPESSRVGNERLLGYYDAMQAAGLPVDPDWVMRGTGENDYGYQAALTLLDLPPTRRPTAIVTIFDMIALGVMRAIEMRGLRVGVDVAVTGFDDLPAIHFLRPGLTTLQQPIAAVGQYVVQMLVAQLKGEKPPTQAIMLPPTLIVRQSTQPDALYDVPPV